MDLGVFYEVIVPLMEMKGAATIFISTPLSTFNFYTELTELRDDRGELLFNVIKVGMVCRRCRGTDKEDQCTHPTGEKPPWKLETTEKMKAIYGHRKTLLMREVMGKVTDSTSLAFEVRDLQAFFARPPTTHPHTPPLDVYVSVDPNGGSGEEQGTGSETAIVSFFYVGANVVVRLRACVTHVRGRARVRKNDTALAGAMRRARVNDVRGQQRNVIGIEPVHEPNDMIRGVGNVHSMRHVRCRVAHVEERTQQKPFLEHRERDPIDARGVERVNVVGIGFAWTQRIGNTRFECHGHVNNVHLRNWRE